MLNMMDIDQETWGALLHWSDGDETSFGDVLGNPTADLMPNPFM